MTKITTEYRAHIDADERLVVTRMQVKRTASIVRVVGTPGPGAMYRQVLGTADVFPTPREALDDFVKICHRELDAMARRKALVQGFITEARRIAALPDAPTEEDAA